MLWLDYGIYVSVRAAQHRYTHAGSKQNSNPQETILILYVKDIKSLV